MNSIRHLVRILLFSALALHATSAQPVNDETYVLRPNDGISLSVYDEPELSVQVRILKTGQASFPLIGSVDLGGLSIAAAAAKIQALYAKDYLVDPKLTLTVGEYATDYISVIGSVMTPGQIPIPVSGQLDLASAMAMAGGLTADANSSDITLVRTSGATMSYSWDDIQGAAGRMKLKSGDRVIVNRSEFVGKIVTILGRVTKPGNVNFPNDGKLDLVTAIALAGGMTELANPKKVSINRKGRVTVVDFREISQRGDRPYRLEPDDIITVAERFF